MFIFSGTNTARHCTSVHHFNGRREDANQMEWALMRIVFVAAMAQSSKSYIQGSTAVGPGLGLVGGMERVGAEKQV